MLCLAGEVDTGSVLPSIFSDNNPALPASADALHWSFPDGTLTEYEPRSGALTTSGFKTATISAAVQVLLNSPLVECTQLLLTTHLDVTDGGTMKGNITHSGGKVLHSHKHPGDSGGQTGTPI